MLKTIIAYLIKTVREEHSIYYIGSKDIKNLISKDDLVGFDAVESEFNKSNSHYKR